MYAKIRDEVVIELVGDLYYDDLSSDDKQLYIASPDNVEIGYRYINDEFVAPTVTPLAPIIAAPPTYKYALVEAGIVKEVYENDPNTLFSPEYAARFVRCPAEVLQGWVYAGGNYSAPPAPPVVVPDEVTMRQARLALHNAGYLTAVNAAVSAAGPVAAIEWEYSNTVKRHRELVAQMQVILNLTDTEIDNLFIAASQLN